MASKFLSLPPKSLPFPAGLSAVAAPCTPLQDSSCAFMCTVFHSADTHCLSSASAFTCIVILAIFEVSKNFTKYILENFLYECICGQQTPLQPHFP